MSDDMTWRKGHWMRKPKPPAAKGISPWLVVFAIIAVAWLLSHGADDSTPAPPPAPVTPTAPAQPVVQ